MKKSTLFILFITLWMFSFSQKVLDCQGEFLFTYFVNNTAKEYFFTFERSELQIIPTEESLTEGGNWDLISQDARQIMPNSGYIELDRCVKLNIDSLGEFIIFPNSEEHKFVIYATQSNLLFPMRITRKYNFNNNNILIETQIEGQQKTLWEGWLKLNNFTSSNFWQLANDCLFFNLNKLKQSNLQYPNHGKVKIQTPKVTGGMSLSEDKPGVRFLGSSKEDGVVMLTKDIATISTELKFDRLNRFVGGVDFNDLSNAELLLQDNTSANSRQEIRIYGVEHHDLLEVKKIDNQRWNVSTISLLPFESRSMCSAGNGLLYLPRKLITDTTYLYCYAPHSKTLFSSGLKIPRLRAPGDFWIGMASDDSAIFLLNKFGTILICYSPGKPTYNLLDYPDAKKSPIFGMPMDFTILHDNTFLFKAVNKPIVYLANIKNNYLVVTDSIEINYKTISTSGVSAVPGSNDKQILIALSSTWESGIIQYDLESGESRNVNRDRSAHDMSQSRNVPQSQGTGEIPEFGWYFGHLFLDRNDIGDLGFHFSAKGHIDSISWYSKKFAVNIYCKNIKGYLHFSGDNPNLDYLKWFGAGLMCQDQCTYTFKIAFQSTFCDFLNKLTPTSINSYSNTSEMFIAFAEQMHSVENKINFRSLPSNTIINTEDIQILAKKIECNGGKLIFQVRDNQKVDGDIVQFFQDDIPVTKELELKRKAFEFSIDCPVSTSKIEMRTVKSGAVGKCTASIIAINGTNQEHFQMESEVGQSDIILVIPD